MPTGLLTIGHSNHQLDHFIELLKRNHVNSIADVRSHPYSRFSPHFGRESLQPALRLHGIQYVFLGRELGARREERECYVDGQARYDLIAQSGLFRQGIDRVIRRSASFRVALMCSEKDPITCHRMILVARELQRASVDVSHIREDGAVESQQDCEVRLLKSLRLSSGDLLSSREQMVEFAYDQQGLRIAWTEDAAGGREGNRSGHYAEDGR